MQFHFPPNNRKQEGNRNFHLPGFLSAVGYEFTQPRTHLLAYSPLGVVEPVHGDDLGLDPLAPPLQLRLGLLRQPPLLLVVVEDGAHVLPAAVRPGVVVLPEHVQQLGVRCHLK